MKIDQDALIQELTFKTSRSGGKGGQHVNKVSSKVLLIWDLENSTQFTEDKKDVLRERLANRLTKDGRLQLDADQDRSQVKNKSIAIQRFIELIQQSLKVEKARIPTKIPKSIVLERLDRKKFQASKKADRQWKFNPKKEY